MSLLIFATAFAAFIAVMLGHRWGADVGLMMVAAFAILLVPAWALS